MSYYSDRLEELKNLSDKELANRYLKRNHKNQKKLNEIFFEVINKRKEENKKIFKYGAIACLNDDLITFIRKEVFENNNSVFINAGYQLKVEQMIVDIEKMLQENFVLTFEHREEPKPSDFLSTIINEYVSEVIQKKLTKFILNEDTASVD